MVQIEPGEDDMKIRFERSGGFAGMLVTTTVDTEALAPEEAQQLRLSIEEADFFALPRKLTAPSPGADHFQYNITVESEGRRHTIETTDVAAPEALRPLLRRLTRLARSTGGGVTS
jgi:hypothetical protein